MEPSKLNDTAWHFDFNVTVNKLFEDVKLVTNISSIKKIWFNTLFLNNKLIGGCFNRISIIWHHIGSHCLLFLSTNSTCSSTITLHKFEISISKVQDPVHLTALCPIVTDKVLLASLFHYNWYIELPFPTTTKSKSDFFNQSRGMSSHCSLTWAQTQFMSNIANVKITVEHPPWWWYHLVFCQTSIICNMQHLGMDDIS